MKNVKIKEFTFDEKELKNASINSLLCDTGVIAKLQFTINDKVESIELYVCGEKRIHFKDEVYRYSSDYPEELTTLIKEGKLDTLDYEPVVDNNWVELMWTENGEYVDCGCLDDTVVDGEFGSGSPKEAYEYLITMIKELYATNDEKVQIINGNL